MTAPSLTSRWAAAGSVLWASAGVQARTTAGVFSVLTAIVMPATYLVLTSRAVDHPGPEVATRIVVGVALMALWGTTLWSGGSVLRRELRDGTFGAAVVGVHPPQLVLLGKSLGSTLHAAALVAPTTAVMVWLLHLPVRAAAPGWLAVGVVVVLASGTALGELLACVFLLTRYGPQLSSALMYPIYLLGGLLIPPEALPAVLRPIAAVISLRWATEFLVAAAAGRILVLPLAIAVGLTVGYFAVGHLAFAGIVRRIRRDGRFEL